MKKTAVVIILIGLFFAFLGGYEIVKTHVNQSKALTEATVLLEASKKKATSLTNNSNSLRSFPTEFNPSDGETVGILHIPTLEADLPIIEGADPDELAKGVGHYKGTAYPLQKNQIVLSGHRETVFRRMGELVLGDILTLKLPYGEFSYEIVATEIVSADDRTVIKPTSPNEILTLTTCYPFNFIGDAPERYIITATPVNTYNK